MLKTSARAVRKWLFLLLVVTVWCGPAVAVEVLPEDSARGEVFALYTHLGQNIEAESNLYLNYSDYRENFRLKAFWKELEALNLARDEMILTIRFLEGRLEGQVDEGVYATVDNRPIMTSSGFLSGVFSNWRPFYFLISGGFFLIISSLLVLATCITRRRNVMTFLEDSFQKSDDEPLKKAA